MNEAQPGQRCLGALNERAPVGAVDYRLLAPPGTPIRGTVAG